MGKRKTPPVKAILLAVALFALGSVLLIVGSLLVTGYLLPIEYGYVFLCLLSFSCCLSAVMQHHMGMPTCAYGGLLAGRDRGIPLLVLGSIAFIPGAYYTRIAYYAWKGYRGYDYSLIPNYD